ncbi:MAG: DUF3306 domain-containing protein [Halomonas sp.]|uniref:DUF3306 domain-containing protein n=1 Tax=Halomonas sp. TaxID=1486246 RepID=UPI003970892F
MSRLSRWSRRKLGVDADEEVLAKPPASRNDHVDQAPAPEPEPGSLDATLPDPDNLPSGSDFKAFLQAGVSDALRRRALRRMFSGDHYGIRDGLDDYDDDYRQQLKPLANELAQRLRQWTRPVEESEPEAEAGESDKPSVVDAAEETDMTAPEAGDDESARGREADERLANQDTSAPRAPLDQG